MEMPMKKTTNTLEIIWGILVIVAYLYLVVANILWPNFSLMAVTFLLTHIFCSEFQKIYKNL
jgi:hypothetical protein